MKSTERGGVTINDYLHYLQDSIWKFRSKDTLSITHTFISCELVLIIYKPEGQTTKYPLQHT